ncbi:threonine dehydratase [Salinarimonas soli]|uniref:Threonine dehydratase n=1 Tax=Salinarimonas soli TaxID=1638099 RepID=A0A5B2VGW6_9HYPH|nr:threonine dehydratase [Salinarimonas soli]KAA2237750.1 threonine dehydratase [Salinarimonas soli]
MFSRPDLDCAATLIHAIMPPTPQYAWPLLRRRYGVEIVVKHENHTPTGAFKVRGGIVYMDRLVRERPQVRGVVSATRGNHGQSLAFAGERFGVPVTIVVPQGNAAEKNEAMRGFGAELIEAGADFDEAKAIAAGLAAERGLEYAPPFHEDLVLGVATYGLELFQAHPDLDTVYVPIGGGSGICGLIRARDLLGLKTRIVGVVSERFDAYARSFECGAIVSTDAAFTFADGMAVRCPVPASFDVIRAGAERIVRVCDPSIAAAIRVLHEDTHNLAEGAGAASLAALAAESESMRGRKVGVILCGGNIDRAWAARILAGELPMAA